MMNQPPLWSSMTKKKQDGHCNMLRPGVKRSCEQNMPHYIMNDRHTHLHITMYECAINTSVVYITLRLAFCEVKHSASQQHMQDAGQNDHRKVNDKLTF